MIKLIFLVFLCLVGCVSHAPDNYREWSNEETPEIFRYGEKWSIILVDENGSMIRNMVVEFSDNDAYSCSSGDFKKLKVISEYPSRSEAFLGEPAYELNGAALIIDLSANLCDAGYEMRGKLSAKGVEGSHRPVSIMGGEAMGRFYGMPLGVNW